MLSHSNFNSTPLSYVPLISDCERLVIFDELRTGQGEHTNERSELLVLEQLSYDGDGACQSQSGVITRLQRCDRAASQGRHQLLVEI